MNKMEHLHIEVTKSVRNLQIKPKTDNKKFIILRATLAFIWQTYNLIKCVNSDTNVCLFQLTLHGVFVVSLN